MRNYFLALMISLFGLVAVGCGTEADPADNFVGAYSTTITVSGQGSETLVDSLSISDGSSSDLIFTSQQLGAMKVSIVGKTSFSIDQQQIMLTSSTGTFAVTLQGQGTVVENVLSASGTLATSTEAFSFTINGQKL